MTEENGAVSDERMLPTHPVELNVLEVGFLVGTLVTHLDTGDRLSRSIFTKLRDAAVALGVEWRYGELP